MSEIINETINELNKPTQNNVFSIEDDPVTVLEKINQVERYLKQIDTRVDTSINTANEALEKANNAFEANGTLVKINGENQLTWSADFAESERQKSITDGAIVHEKEIADVEYTTVIYDKNDSSKNIINGTAYTSGLYTSGINIGDTGAFIPLDAKRLRIYYCSYFVNNTQNGGNSNVVEMDVTNYMTEWKETCTVNSFRNTVNGMDTTLFKMSVAVNNVYMNVKFFHNEELKTDGSSYIYKLEVVK